MLNLIRSDLYEMRHKKSLFVCLIITVLVTAISIASIGIVKLAFVNKDSEYNREQVISQFSEESTFIEGFQKGFYMGLNEAATTIDVIGNESTKAFYEKLKNGTLSSVEAMKYSFGDGVTIPMLLGIFISIYVGGEFSKKTINNKISKGFSRSSIYLSKLVVSSVASIFFTVITAVVYGIISIVILGISNISETQIYDYLLTFFCSIIIHIAFASLFTMISVLVKNSAAAVAINVGFICSLTLSLSLIDVMRGEMAGSSSFWIGSLISKTQIGIISAQLFSNALVLSVGYIFFTTFLGLYVLNKRDI